MNIDPREWDLQERALREDAAYREVARALRRSPGEPPADFAASVAALVAAAPAVSPAASRMVPVPREDLLEHWLLRAFAMVLGAAFVYAVARYGTLWREGFDALAPMLGGSSALNWALAAGACMALSWGFAQGGARLRRPHR